MSQPQQQFSRESAWRSKKQEIETFVRDGRDIDRSRVAYMKSAHGSGKSTTFIRYLITRMKHDPPNTAAPTSDDPEEFKKGISINFSGLSSRYVISHYEGFVEHVCGSNTIVWPKGLTILVDVELRASAFEEIFFGLLMELARNETLNIFLMAPHRSPRTISAFQRVTGPIAHRAIISTCDSVDLVGTFEDSEIGEITSSNVALSMKHDGNQSSTDPVQIFAVDPELGPALVNVSGVRLLVSYGTTQWVVFDKSTSQLLLKRKPDGKAVEHCVMMSETSYKKLLVLNGPWGPAWNAHMSLLVLWICDMWPGWRYDDMPVGDPPDKFALDETVRRLQMTGFLTRSGAGRGAGMRLTREGEHALELMRESPDRVDIHVASLLVAARSEKPRVQRALVTMAAISSRNAGDFYTMEYLETDGGLSPQAVFDQCAGINLQYPSAVIRGCTMVNPAEGFEIKRTIDQFAMSLGIDAPTPDMAVTMLTNEEIATVERRLMWAWLYRVLYRVVGISCVESHAFDISSCHDVFPDWGAEIIDVEAKMRDSENVRLGGFFAIYDSLELRVVGNKEIHVPQGFTIIPQRLFREVEEKTDISWPTAVVTAYPLLPKSK
ncbi:hypothetical protein F4677DRAFT_446985 [Hypoxylon crocopeplum]|nr:hypothetical protein F4677DRAFT_446985 [Hypoxylon crocopeplum]